MEAADWRPPDSDAYKMDLINGKNMTMISVDGPWTGCVFLFLESTCPEVDLLDFYKDPEKKFALFKVIKLMLSDAAGGLDGYEILKLHDADPRLGVELKFVEQRVCRRFLESCGGPGGLAQLFSQHAARILCAPDDFTAEVQLKAGAQVLDASVGAVDRCLHYINLLQPDRLKDDEVSQLERQLQNLALGNHSTSHVLPSAAETHSAPTNCFLFQNKVFDDRQLTPADQQRFATSIGRDWKKVGRALQKTCRALKGPAIDNLAFEYEREGLYEQAYQLLGRFIQAEGRNARLGRLVRALEETRLVGMAEIMLELQPKE